jgi:RNA polymerase sigma factor (sigma-70 family)
MLPLKAMNETTELLRAWVEHGAEDAFATLVARHIDLVYSVAVRKVAGDTGLAADVTQIVFADLARKASSLRAEGSLAGWLHRHTCHVAATALRGELRRRVREQTAAAMHALEHSNDLDWSRLAPLLDDAVNALADADRRAILLRFYERCDLRAIGATLGVGDDAAQKRVSRALEKLRDWLTRRGVTSTTAALATMLGAHSVSAAPGGMAAAVTSSALTTAAATAAGAGAATLFEIMTHAKVKLAVAAVLAATVVTPLVWQESAIARTRNENQALAGRAASPDQVRPEAGQIAATPVADVEAAQAARDRAELERLRNEVGTLRRQLQQAQAARLAALQAAGGTGRAGREFPPGYVTLQNARDVGAGTGAALMQTFAWAIRNGDTNRLLQLVDLTSDAARAEAAAQLHELLTQIASGGIPPDAMNAGFRVLREVPLEESDAAVVLDNIEGANTQPDRVAFRIRRTGNGWRLVFGEDGPEVMKLPENLMRD